MFAFLLQTALMMLVAYFAGAFVGCIVRRTFFAHTLAPVAAKVTSRPARVQAPAPVVAQPVVPAPVTRFERALTGTGSAASAPAAPVAQPAPPAPIALPPARPIIPGPVAAPSPATAPASASAPTPAPAQGAGAASPTPPPAVAAAAAAAAAAMAAVAKARADASAAPAITLPAAMGTSGPAAVTAPIAPATAPKPPAPAPAPVAMAPDATPKPTPQDLTRIRAIDEQQQKQLNALGVGTYADIAAWRPEDVARIGAALKIPGRIEQENWIEQAQILAKGGETYYSRRKMNGELATARPTPDEGERITVRVPAATRPAEIAPPAPVSPAAGSGAELKAAAATAAAAVLAAQAATAPRLETAAVPAASEQAPAAKPVPAPVIAVPAAQQQPSAPAEASAASRPVGMSRDNLQRIAGVNAEVERLLNVQGVTRYSQIAGWGPTDVARFDRLLGFEGRVARENWIEQAQILSKGGETAYSREMARRAAESPQPARLADALQARNEAAAPPREDLAALRSVRSEAYRAPDAPGAAAAAAARAPDDLKRIRGVGVLIEKKLNALGVTRYDQVANWNAADIERFSDKLDFKGRIERENWVEQARILSAGGQTEFSQRVDRGEV